MTWHLVVAPGRANSTLLHMELMFWLLTEKFLADAVETSAPRSTLAPTVARSNLPIFISKSLVDVDYETETCAACAQRRVSVAVIPPFRRRRDTRATRTWHARPIA